jgi:TRAP-type mannitol/chloroaromatic compound transport system permease small subunit
MSKGQVSIFGVIAFLIVFVILFALVFAPFMNVASDISSQSASENGGGIVAFVVSYWSFIVFLCFIIAFGWKIYAG